MDRTGRDEDRYLFFLVFLIIIIIHFPRLAS